MHVGVLCNTIKDSQTGEVEQDLFSTSSEIISAIKNKGFASSIMNADDNLIKNIKQKKYDVIFNICERFNDNSDFEPHIAAMLELSGVPFTGSSHSTLTVCNDKLRSKEILTSNNILTPKYQLFSSVNHKLDSELNFPLIVKPRQQENSIGINKDSVVNDKESLRKVIRKVMEKYGKEALVEEFISGDEIEVSIIGNGNDLTFLSTAKLTYKNNNNSPENFFHYESKWNGNSQVYGDYTKANLSNDVETKLKNISINIYKLFKIRDYGRIDFRLSKDSKLFVIEVTANPGLSKVSSTPQAAGWMGWSYQELILKIIDTTKKRYNETTNRI